MLKLVFFMYKFDTVYPALLVTIEEERYDVCYGKYMESSLVCIHRSIKYVPNILPGFYMNSLITVLHYYFLNTYK